MSGWDQTMRRLFVLAICFAALLLPMRLRVWLSEVLGWILQLGYWIAFKVTRFMVRQLE